MRSRTVRAAILLLISTLTLPEPAISQDRDRWEAPRWVGDLTFLSLNSLSGGISAGIFRKLRGGSFRDGVAVGMAGGAIHYAGRRLAAEQFSGAGLLGRQLATTGAVITRNSSEGLGPFERLWFAAGPVNLYLELGEEISFIPKVNLPALVSVAYLAAQPETEFDFGASLSAGVPVMRAPGKQFRTGDNTTVGVFAHGTILLGEMPEELWEEVFAHERVHALQADWDLQAWSHPVETEALRRIPGGSAVARYVDFNLVAGAFKLSAYGLLGVADPERLYQLEANFLEE